MDIASLPFNQHLGIAVDDGAIVLSPETQHMNHVDTVHASVLYGLAEAASGLCLLNTYTELASHTALLRSAEVKYRKPAFPDSELRAAAALRDTDPELFMKKLVEKKRGTLDLNVSIQQKEVEVFRGVFTWFLAIDPQK